MMFLGADEKDDGKKIPSMTDEEKKKARDEFIRATCLPFRVCDDDEVDRAESERMEQEKQRHFEKSGAPERFFRKSLEGFDACNEEMKKNLSAVREFIDEANFSLYRDLWLCGANGNGKSHLGAMIARECWGVFAESSTIEDEVEETKHYGAKETMSELRRRYASCRMLVIDEVGRFPSEDEKKYLFRILNDRYNARRPTVLITNMAVKELKAYLGKGIVDRAVEACRTLEFSSPSYRQEERKKNFGGKD